MKIKAALFDLDGVLVDTARYHYEAWLVLANQLSIPFTEKENEQLKGISTRAIAVIWKNGTEILRKREISLC